METGRGSLADELPALSYTVPNNVSPRSHVRTDPCKHRRFVALVPSNGESDHCILCENDYFDHVLISFLDESIIKLD
jgi:hypothetical protein